MWCLDVGFGGWYRHGLRCEGSDIWVDGGKTLTEVTIPDSVTSIGNWTFSWCEKLLEVTIPNSVTSIGTSAFNGCGSLAVIKMPSSVVSIGEWAFGSDITIVGEKGSFAYVYANGERLDFRVG